MHFPDILLQKNKKRRKIETEWGVKTVNSQHFDHEISSP
jgi:hypothetical protein